MLRNMKIGIKILLVLLLMSLGTLLIIAANSYLQMMSLTTEFQEVNTLLGDTASEDSKQALQSQMEDSLVKITQRQANITNEKLIQLRAVIENGAGYLENIYENEEQFPGHELPYPYETKAGVSCSKYMLAPGVEDSESLQRQVRLVSNCDFLFGTQLENTPMLDNLYLGTEDGISYRYSKANTYNPDYDPRERDWYRQAAATEQTIWMDTYRDYYGKICLTCAKRFHDAKGEIKGVLSTDITVQDMLDDIVSTTLGQSGYAFVLDDELKYLAHPQYGEAGFGVYFASHADISEDDLSNIYENMQGIVKAKVDGAEKYIAFSTLEETGWKLCICIDVSEVIEPSIQTKAEIDGITAEAQGMVSDTLSRIMLRFIIFFALVGIVAIIISFTVAGTITRPIQKLAKNVENIGQGELDIRMEVESKDEVGELAQTFNQMLEDLQQYITNLSEVTAEKERIGAELDVARNIQASMLPCLFPAFPEHKEFDIYATMNPAKEVGGDFYDFFLIDEDHLAMVMADVSGKGVPAALFMVIAKTLIKNRAQLGESPEQVLEKVNNQLCENNEADMFVTVWLGIYEISTGKLSYANAGHEYPAIMRTGGQYELLVESHDFVLGGLEGMPYTLYETYLGKGDKLFLYTDGVPEATNSREELFGEERMVKVLNSCLELSPKHTLLHMKEQIDIFVGEADPFDDLTMLCIEIAAVESRG